MVTPKAIVVRIAMGEYPQVEIDSELSTLSVVSKVVTRAMNMDCETSQCSRPEIMSKGIL